MTPLTQVAVAFVVALGAGLALQPLAISVLGRRGAVDTPTERSSHSVPTVRGGGIAVVAALTIAYVVSMGSGTTSTAAVLASVLLCAAVGLVEDLRGVPVLARFGLLVLACAPLAAVPTGSVAWIVAAGVLCVVFAVAVVNATNFMDGINGISAAQGVAAGAAYAALAAWQGLNEMTVLAVALVGASLSFAPFNVPRARVFLGDTGSYALGAALAGLAVLTLAEGLPVEAALAPLALYLADTGTTLLRRVRAGDAWHLPHRTHVYQRLTDSGLTHSQVSALVLATVLICGLLGLASLGGPVFRVSAGMVLIVVIMGYLSLPTWLATRRAAA